VAGRLAACVDAAREAGWRAWFVTLTLAHEVYDTLAKCLRAARRGWDRVKRKLADRPDVAGHVVAWEITLGRAGWHVHAHALVWTYPDLEIPPPFDDVRSKLTAAARTALGGDGWQWHTRRADGTTHTAAAHGYAAALDLRRRLDALRATRPESAGHAYRLRDDVRCAEDDLRRVHARAIRLGWARADRWALTHAITQAWADGAAATGMARPDWRRQDVRPARDVDRERRGKLVRYVLKTAYEVAGGAYKSGRGSSFTPAELLHSAAAGCHEGRRAWREYREAVHGLHRIAGIAALERRLAPAPPPPRPDPVTVVSLRPHTYSSLREVSYDRVLVRVAEAGSPLDVAGICDRAGEFPTRADWRRAAADTLGVIRLQAAGGSLWDCHGSTVGPLAAALGLMYLRTYGIADNHKPACGVDVDRGLAGDLARKTQGRGGYRPRRLVTEPPRRRRVPS
jgi:hypothetical protein